MTKENNFLKDCIKVVAGLDIKSESQAIAKEVVLSTLKNYQQNQENLIKYIEDKIRILGICVEKAKTERDQDELEIRRGTFIEILERIKSGKYE